MGTRAYSCLVLRTMRRILFLFANLMPAEISLLDVTLIECMASLLSSHCCSRGVKWVHFYQTGPL